MYIFWGSALVIGVETAKVTPSPTSWIRPCNLHLGCYLLVCNYLQTSKCTHEWWNHQIINCDDKVIDTTSICYRVDAECSDVLWWIEFDERRLCCNSHVVGAEHQPLTIGPTWHYTGSYSYRQKLLHAYVFHRRCIILASPNKTGDLQCMSDDFSCFSFRQSCWLRG